MSRWVETETEITDQDAGVRIFSTLLSGIVLYGGLGWIGDHFLHTGFLLPVGILIGLGLSLYLIIKRHGSAE